MILSILMWVSIYQYHGVDNSIPDFLIEFSVTTGFRLCMYFCTKKRFQPVCGQRHCCHTLDHMFSVRAMRNISKLFKIVFTFLLKIYSILIYCILSINHHLFHPLAGLYIKIKITNLTYVKIYHFKCVLFSHWQPP